MLEAFLARKAPANWPPFSGAFSSANPKMLFNVRILLLVMDENVCWHSFYRLFLAPLGVLFFCWIFFLMMWNGACRFCLRIGRQPCCIIVCLLFNTRHGTHAMIKSNPEAVTVNLGRR